jgi:hypothetical protein
MGYSRIFPPPLLATSPALSPKTEDLHSEERRVILVFKNQFRNISFGHSLLSLTGYRSKKDIENLERRKYMKIERASTMFIINY